MLRCLRVSLAATAALLATAPTQAQFKADPNSGCPGSRPAGATGTPKIGRTIQLSWSCFTEVPLLIVGPYSRPGIRLWPPMTCSTRGCDLVTTPVITIVGEPRRAVTATLTIPWDPSLLGTQLFATQGACYDPGRCFDLSWATVVCVDPQP